jgi:hypothetical protein
LSCRQDAGQPVRLKGAAGCRGREQTNQCAGFIRALSAHSPNSGALRRKFPDRPSVRVYILQHAFENRRGLVNFVRAVSGTTAAVDGTMRKRRNSATPESALL